MMGIRINRITSVSDNKDEIISSLDEALSRAEVVLITGGLGPTSDDITKDTLAGFFGGKLVMDNEVLENVTERLRRRNLQMNENNRRQAMVPDNCKVLQKPHRYGPRNAVRKKRKDCCINARRSSRDEAYYEGACSAVAGRQAAGRSDRA